MASNRAAHPYACLQSPKTHPPRVALRRVLRRAEYPVLPWFPHNLGPTLFKGRQRSLNNLVNGFVSAAGKDSLDSAFLFRREMNRHGFHLVGAGNSSLRKRYEVTG